MPSTNKYLETQVMTASPMQLILMLYDECIQSLEQAENAFGLPEEERIETVNNHILHAEDIITELAVSLDMEQGGEIAQNLQRLYDFMLDHLSDANVKKEVRNVVEVKNMMVELRESWQKVSEQESKKESDFTPSRKSHIMVNG